MNEVNEAITTPVAEQQTDLNKDTDNSQNSQAEHAEANQQPDHDPNHGDGSDEGVDTKKETVDDKKLWLAKFIAAAADMDIIIPPDLITDETVENLPKDYKRFATELYHAVVGGADIYTWIMSKADRKKIAENIAKAKRIKETINTHIDVIVAAVNDAVGSKLTIKRVDHEALVKAGQKLLELAEEVKAAKEA